jgi:surface protein
VTDLDFVFQGATNFNQAISNWDISNVKTMIGTFNNATKFNQPIGNWNTAEVTNMSSTFKGALDFNQTLNTWNTSNVTTMSSMFKSASSFNQPITSWNISKLNSISSCMNFLDSCGMDCPNYTALLMEWGNNVATPYNISFGAKGLTYGTNGVTSRDNLVNLKGWNFFGDTDYGFNCVQFPLNTSSSLQKNILYTLAPNPSNGILFLNIESNSNNWVDVSIRDLFGKELLHNTTNLAIGKNKINLPVSVLSSGLYIVHFTINGLSYNVKFELTN